MLKKEIEELEELGKPIVHSIYINIVDTGIGYFEITYEGKNFTQCYFTKDIEQKENILITDDFIFVKEDL